MFVDVQMHPSTAYYSFFGCLKPKRKVNRTLIVPIGGYQSGKSYFAKHHLLESQIVNALEMKHFERDRVFFKLKASGCSLKRAKQQCHETLLKELEGNKALMVYVDSTNTTKEQRLFYCQRFGAQKVVLIQFEIGSNVKEQDKWKVFEEMAMRAKQWREERGIPVSDEMMDTDRMMVQIEMIWNQIECVDEEEVREMKCVMAPKSKKQVIVFRINALDFECRESVAYQVFVALFCNHTFQDHVGNFRAQEVDR